jgi:Raf kinase inhibitor-like YbhB/YbcL family protein
MKTAFAVSLFVISQATAALAAPFQLTSPDFKAGGTIPEKDAFNSFGCTGGNASPALAWANAPAGTKSFALMVHDPDAPTGGSGVWHWVAYDIPATTTSLPGGAGGADGKGMPKGAVLPKNDMGIPGWGGPCPPPGPKHHYNFTLYALKVEKLEIPPGASLAITGYMINANALGKAKLTGLYARPKAPAPAK